MKDAFLSLHHDLAVWQEPFTKFFATQRTSGQTLLEHVTNTTQLAVITLNKYPLIFRQYACHIKDITLASFFHDTIDIKYTLRFLKPFLPNSKLTQLSAHIERIKIIEETIPAPTPETIASLMIHYTYVAELITMTLKRQLPREADHISPVFTRTLIGFALSEYLAETVQRLRSKIPEYNSLAPVQPSTLPIIDQRLLILLLLITTPLALLIKSAEKVDNLLNPLPPNKKSYKGRPGAYSAYLDAIEAFYLYIPWAQANSLSYLIYALKEAALRHLGLFWSKNYTTMAKIISYKLKPYYKAQHQLYDIAQHLVYLISQTPMTPAIHSNIISHTKLPSEVRQQIRSIQHQVESVIRKAASSSIKDYTTIVPQLTRTIASLMDLTDSIATDTNVILTTENLPHRNINNLFITRPTLVNISNIKTTPSILIKSVNYALKQSASESITPDHIISMALDLSTKIPDLIGVNVIVKTKPELLPLLRKLHSNLQKHRLDFKHPLKEPALTEVQYNSGYKAVHFVINIPQKAAARRLFTKIIDETLLSSPHPPEIENSYIQLQRLVNTLPPHDFHLEIRFYTPEEADIAYNKATPLVYKSKVRINNIDTFALLEGLVRNLTTTQGPDI